MSIRPFLLGLSLAVPNVASSTPQATAPSPAAQDSEDAVYLRRFANVAAGRSGYDSSMEAVPGALKADPLPRQKNSRISSDALNRATDYAMTRNSSALLIWLDGKLQHSTYGPTYGPAIPINSGSMSKPLGSVAIGRAIQLGAIRSVDQPVADFILEWRGTPKSAITIRHLLSMTAGLLEQGQSADPANIWSRAYLHPRHDRILIDEYPLSAKPGTVFQYSNASADLIAIVIERATGKRYAKFISDAVLKPLDAMGGSIWLDRPGGLAHSGCCILLPAETWLRLGLLLMDDGVWRGKQLLPKGFVTAMRTPSAQHPRNGMGIWLPGDYVQRRGFGRDGQQGGAQVLHGEPYLAKDLFLFDGNGNQVLYRVPSKRLAILRTGAWAPQTREWDNAVLPNLILRDLASFKTDKGRSQKP